MQAITGFSETIDVPLYYKCDKFSKGDTVKFASSAVNIKQISQENGN